MNPALLAGLYRWAAILVIGVALFGMGFLKGCQHEQAKLEVFEAGTKALGDAQVAHTKQINQQQSDNLHQVTHDLLLNVQAAGDVAVANYRDRYPVRVCGANPGRGAVPGPAASQQGHDASTLEPVAAQTDEFVKACAHDAAILDAWQFWASMNNIPIE